MAQSHNENDTDYDLEWPCQLCDCSIVPLWELWNCGIVKMWDWVIAELQDCEISQWHNPTIVQSHNSTMAQWHNLTMKMTRTAIWIVPESVLTAALSRNAILPAPSCVPKRNSALSWGILLQSPRARRVVSQWWNSKASSSFAKFV